MKAVFWLLLVISAVAAFDYNRLRSLHELKRGVLIDLGANCGNSYMIFKKQFLRRREHFEYYLFEPNPYLIDSYLSELVKRERGVSLIEAAGWTQDGTTDFYLDSNESKKECDPDSNRNPRGASSIFKDKYHPRSGKKITVLTIDMNKWMLENVRPEDYCVLKIDIEGAEYELLRHLMVHGAMKLVDELYVEFHEPYDHKSAIQWMIEAYPCKTIKRWH